MLAGLLFLLLTGGITFSYSDQPELHDDQQKSNQTLEEGGSPSDHSEQLELQQNFSQSSEKDGESSKSSCGYRDVLKYLNLTKNELQTMTLPVRNYKSSMKIQLAVLLNGILDVKEKDQKFVSYISTFMFWNDEYIRWDPDDFCGIDTIYISTEALWKPDLIIEQMIEKGEAPGSPYLMVTYEGSVVFKKCMVVVSTCRMQVYRFPFDVQSCNLTFKSSIHFDDALQIEEVLNSSVTSEWSHEMIQTQSEWVFIDMIVSKETVYNQSSVIYTIIMKRRSLLYVVNFLLPILFFMCLDLAAFLISDNGGEKLSFKVTVLLAVTVMQLILNDILPSSSNKIPLIAVYCIGMFTLMMLSLMETIVVMHLVEKDSASQENEADKDQSVFEDYGDQQNKVCCREVKKLHCMSICDVSPGETPSERPSVTEHVSSNRLTECHDSEKLSDELNDAVKTMTLVLNNMDSDSKPKQSYRGNLQS
ncbi:5-hydroxytryptamine receptor 3A-like [Plectropomus leopardus]|uniref:5-hydroxytryptamine receptor 3A-like n=1 Tax=Plectropomus leopardus TaxID=160734 RepID=UPI001C4DC355|nr:5-hydroxytryptamine receptor 3A-like [Plectropomus leopardus]